MWIWALVEPPIAEFTVIAFSKASLVITWEGDKSSLTISTILRPVLNAICPRSLYGAGILAFPVKLIPNASAREFIVEAVPIVLQFPSDGAELVTISINCS